MNKNTYVNKHLSLTQNQIEELISVSSLLKETGYNLSPSALVRLLIDKYLLEVSNKLIKGL